MNLPASRLPRALLLVPVTWWTFSLATGVSSWCFLDLVNLAFHEAGHLLLRFAGSTMHYLGGTLGQLAVPAYLVFRFLRQDEDRFAAALCTWWAGENLINIGHYMGDARSLDLPLVGGGDHDWNELFYRFGMLGESSVQTVAKLTHLAGVLIMLGGLGWAALLLLGPAGGEVERTG
jgi:hypothetical protein